MEEEKSEIDLKPALFPDETTIKVVNKNTGKISYIIIDKEKEDMLNKYTWYINKDGYAQTNVTNSQKQRNVITMHRLLLEGDVIDHVDRNKINNSMKNLRISTAKLNALNKARRINCKSKYRGVTYKKKHKKFYVYVNRKYIGCCDDEVSAAFAYNEYVTANFKTDEFFVNNLNDITKPENYSFTKSKAKMKSDLPKGLFFSPSIDKYVLKVTYKDEKWKKVYIKNKEDAIKKYNELKNILKQKWEEKMNALEITRNLEGVAVIRTSKWCEKMSDREKEEQEILVDDDEWHKIMKIGSWHISDGYAANRKLMHRVIMNCKEYENNCVVVDHINNNRKDNRKFNLRILDKRDSLNAHNKKKTTGRSSKFKGVCFSKTHNKWLMQITYKGVKTTKYFDTQEEAARYYDEKAKEFYGENAKVNFPMTSKVFKKRIFEETKSEISRSQKDENIENACKRPKISV